MPVGSIVRGNRLKVSMPPLATLLERARVRIMALDVLPWLIVDQPLKKVVNLMLSPSHLSLTPNFYNRANSGVL